MPLARLCLHLLAPFLVGLAVAQIADPIPEPIEFGEITIHLEDWVTLPASSGGGGGRARLSVMRHLADGRLFVNDQRGLIHRIEEGHHELYFNVRAALPAFIDQPGFGTGLHSFAFHPAFASNGKLYTVHSERWNAGTPDLQGPVATRNSAGQMSVLSEWTATDPAAAVFAGTRREVFRVYFPGTIHCAQEIAFHPNAGPGDRDYGLLYVCLGDGGGYLRGLWQNQQRLDSPMGAVLRIDPLGTNAPNGRYGIPPDNPWAESPDPSVRKELYALGFRNPHRINWDTGGTGRAFVGDIGERNIEELNLLVAGGNYGFPQREGTFRLDPTKPEENDRLHPLPADDGALGYLYPVAQYDHDEGFSIAGGPVYRGSLAPALAGKVLFGDIVRGRVFLVAEAALGLGLQAPIEEARLTLAGVPGSLPSFVGNSRADLRFGMDAAGEVFVMTKTDGKIRRIVGSSGPGAGFIEDPARWVTVADFTAASPPLTIEVAEPTGTAWTRPDPFGDGANRALALRGAGTQVEMALPPTVSGESGQGSTYFRFALGGTEALATFALSSGEGSALPVVRLEVDGTGVLTLVDADGSSPIASGLRAGIWYEVWVVFPGGESPGQCNVYVRGDRWTAPSLLAAGRPPLSAVGSGLNRFSVRLAEGSGERPGVHLDDLSVDPDGANLSAAWGGGWALVADFEDAVHLAYWDFTDTTPAGAVASAPATASVVEEGNGNRALRFAAAPAFGTRSHARARLPFRVEVSDVVTLFLRMRVEDFATNQVWGLANVPEAEILGLAYDAFAASGRWTDENGLAQLLVRDHDLYQAATTGPLAEGVWLDSWLVVNNGGQASGGQTFALYSRPSGSGLEPALVYADAGFRLARETPMDVFQLIANNGASGKAGAILYDDLYLADGVRLETPGGIGWGLYHGRRGWKEIPELGWVRDDAFPWVYHEAHGWLFAADDRPGGDWHYDRVLGWIWLQPAAHPFLYVHAWGEWVYFWPTSSDARWFYRMSSETWVPRPRS
jgi:glucose/arabinose dehydrogenase